MGAIETACGDSQWELNIRLQRSVAELDYSGSGETRDHTSRPHPRSKHAIDHGKEVIA